MASPAAPNAFLSAPSSPPSKATHFAEANQYNSSHVEWWCVAAVQHAALQHAELPASEMGQCPSQSHATE